MDGSSPLVLPTGSVGSLLGLKPYSSISFLRISSAFFRSFRFRQNQIPASTISTTATIGTTVATAMVLGGVDVELPSLLGFAKLAAPEVAAAAPVEEPDVVEWVTRLVDVEVMVVTPAPGAEVV
jgi:hypothetical protein